LLEELRVFPAFNLAHFSDDAEAHKPFDLIDIDRTEILL
jgi:hypothetical protein